MIGTRGSVGSQLSDRLIVDFRCLFFCRQYNVFGIGEKDKYPRGNLDKRIEMINRKFKLFEEHQCKCQWLFVRVGCTCLGVSCM